MKSIQLLLVDDDVLIRQTLEGYLEDEGFSIHSVSTGEEALEILQSHKIDVGIIDMRLPGIDGNELILKAHKLYPELKFVIHTGSMGYLLPKSLVNIGISHKQIFKKPIKKMDEFISAIRQLIQNKNG